MGLKERIARARMLRAIYGTGLSPRIQLRKAIRASQDGGLLVHVAIERGELAMPA